MKKLIVGWFSFTCSEDSTILFTELLNQHFTEWKNLIDFKVLNPLKSPSPYDHLDVAFIEGAISSEKQAEKVRAIRQKSQYVIAIGSCAVTGLPSASRNEFTDETLKRVIEEHLKQFDYSGKVRKLADVIKVDDTVDGCPMDVPSFQAILEKYLKLFSIYQTNDEEM